MNNNITGRTSRGMKWHNFLIYFSLWAAGIINIAVGIIYLVYPATDSFNYYMYDIGEVALMGFFSLIMGIYAIVTRFKLAKWHASAPGHLIAYSVLSAIFSAVMGSIEGTLTLETIIGSIVFIIINCVYYNNRKDMFVC